MIEHVLSPDSLGKFDPLLCSLTMNEAIDSAPETNMHKENAKLLQKD